VVHGLVGDCAFVVLRVFALRLQVVHFVKAQHDVVINVSDLKHCDQLEVRWVRVYL
jgi:hypothetical protein